MTTTTTTRAFKPADLIEVATVLDAAASHLHTQGWRQDAYVRFFLHHIRDPKPAPGICALTAIQEIVRGEPGRPYVFNTIDEAILAANTTTVLADYLSAHGLAWLDVPDPYLRVVAWNDQEDQTQDRVVATLAAAAEAVHDSLHVGAAV